MKCIIFLLLLMIYFQGCKNKSDNNLNETAKIEYPDGKPGNYVVLSDGLIKGENLTEEKLKKMQFYTSEDIRIKIATDKSILKDTQFVKIRSIFIKKFTPCVITKKITSDKDIKKMMNKKILGKKHSATSGSNKKYTQEEFKRQLDFVSPGNGILGIKGEYIERGYEVEFGNGISLVYDPSFKFFTRVYKYKNKINISNSSFDNNASLLFEIVNPIVKYNFEDTITVPGKRK